MTPPRRPLIRYLLSVDEGIAYQLEYLRYLEDSGVRRMACPTHMIFATSSKSLFCYVCTNLQCLFVEIEDLTVECKLLPSSINLMPNTREMAKYYRDARKKNKQYENENENENENDNEMEASEGITEQAIREEMEYDLLHCLSIPHILYHHRLADVYEAHAQSKLSRRLRRKWEPECAQQMQGLLQGEDEAPIDIEMFYAGIPFVGQLLENVCRICRIPLHQQHCM